jgi:uncharacterized protein
MVESFFFGTDTPRLFGSYHPPIGCRREHALLLCPALGHEYVQCHFAYRLLAAQLAEAGFPVLRFEYRGLGNAEGSLADASLEDWMGDSNRALEELARRSGACRLCVGGIRFGATLSALASGTTPSVAAILLWYPVIEGPAYLREIAERQAAFVRSLPGPLPVPSDGGQEILGFRLGAALLEQLAGIEARRLGRCLVAKRVLLLEDRAVHVDEAARQSLAAGCAGFEAHCEAAEESWLGKPQRIFEPRKALEQISSWMESLG